MDAAASATPQSGKSIVLCSDGTGNTDIKARGSNVFKLYEAVDIQGHNFDPANRRRQVAFYDEGVGTESFLPLKLLGGALGWGFCRNIRELYTELVHAYEPGDWLYLFGFSRGAYTIRALAGMIQYCGIVDPRSDAALATKDGLDAQVERCWNAFYAASFTSEWDSGRISRMPAAPAAGMEPPAVDEQTAGRRREFFAHAPETPIRIRFLGVWDTVGAVGMPIDELKFLTDLAWPSRFNELTVGREVERACHALAIDDERRTFWPELWNEAGARDGQLEQVWFAGVHANVGGGYPKHGMSLVTLDWMMAQVELQGLRFIAADRDYVRNRQDVHDTLYDSRAGAAVYYRWDPRDIAALCARHGIARPKVHASVFERIALGTNGYSPGNLPVELEVVGTPVHPFPTAEQRADVERLVDWRVGATSQSSLLRLPEVQRWVRLGKLSYFGFLGLTLAALLRVLWLSIPAELPFLQQLWHAAKLLAKAAWSAVSDSPLGSADALWSAIWKMLATDWWWVLVGLALCWWLARWVDKRMERRFARFWYEYQPRLRALLLRDGAAPR